MLRWLWNLFIRRDERRIFSYWDGKARASVDPIPTWYALYYDQEISLDREQAIVQLGDDRKTLEALLRLDPLLRRVFKIKPYEQGGLTVDECQSLMVDFLEYMGDVKKNGSGSPTLPEPTESVSSGQSPTNAVSDSGQTASGSSSENVTA